VGHDEDRRVERRLLRPRLLAGFEHALAHHAGAGALECLLRNVVVAFFLAALAELQVLPEEPVREDPQRNRAGSQLELLFYGSRAENRSAAHSATGH
jgi:hypothetical protein